MGNNPWDEQSIPEKIGTVIGTAIGIAIVAWVIISLITGQFTIASIFTFFAEAFLWIIIGLVALFVIICFFPGVIIVILAALALLAVILIGGLIAGIVGLF